LAAGGALVFTVPLLNVLIMQRGSTLADLSSDRSFNDRYALLSSIGEYFSLLGRGIGAYSGASRAVQESTLDNTFVVLLGELGVVGLGLGCAILIRQFATRGQLSLAVASALLVGATAAPVLGNAVAFLSFAFGPDGVDTTRAHRPSKGFQRRGDEGETRNE
jgi:hypothetical protein